MAGLLAINNVNLDAIPDLSDVQVIVNTEWPGRAPTLVEDQITYPIVSALSAAPGVRYARGQTFFGLSFVTIVFEDGTDMYWARSRVLEYMNQVQNQLPVGVSPSLGPDATGVGWVYQYALVDETGTQNLADLRSFQDWTLRYYLQTTPGVAEVASIGGHVNQYQVTIDPNDLAARRLTIGRVIDAIRGSNNSTGGRVLEFGETEYMVRAEGYIESLEDIEKTAVGVTDQGVPITVRDIARVTRGPEIRRGVLDIDGKGEAVGGIVIMRYGANALKTITAVKEKLEAIKPSLPEGVEIVTGYDRSGLIVSAIRSLRDTLIEEMIIVSVAIIVFLFHVRSALVAIIVLPVAVIISFIPMVLMGISSNIMSLGGIAIAIGAMVDSAIVLIDNAHKWLTRWNDARSKIEAGESRNVSEEDRELAAMQRLEVIVRASQQVGKPLFYSLAIIAVAFLPVFALEAQSGRLFKPLAYTKTFAMSAAAVLSITLVPLLAYWFIRGRIPKEENNYIGRFLIWIYEPFVNFALRFRFLTILLAVVIAGVSWFPFSKIGWEFMPPLNEGSLLYMPSSPPGMSITESKRILQRQDAVIAELPEVERVYGKIGRAKTATDPAPISMAETVITLKPKDEWRPGMTLEKIKRELTGMLPIPGMPATWWMPIQTRIEMLATGIRSEIGIKVMGPDLAVIQRISEDIEALLSNDANTASVFAERVTGGYYLDFEIDRSAITRYGLTVANVQHCIEAAVGGMNVTSVIEGREQYLVNVRYSRDFRSDIPALRRVLISTPAGGHILLGQVADIELKQGPPMIRNENGMLAGFVFIDTIDINLETYVDRAKDLIAQNVDVPPKYYLDWGGQYEHMVKARKTLQLIVPITLMVIFVLLFIEFRAISETLIVILSVPFALIGGAWLMWLLDYNFSIAAAVGFIALAGVAAETGVMMIVYLNEAWNNLVASQNGRLDLFKLRQAVVEGAVQRVRPKVMTVCTTIIALLPIMWSTGTGADTMKRIAAPMIGGMVSSSVLTLVIIPAIYYLYRSRQLVGGAGVARAGGIAIRQG